MLANRQLARFSTNFHNRKLIIDCERTRSLVKITIERTVSKYNHNSNGRHVLALNDTIDFNLDSHKGRIDMTKGFGLSSDTTMEFKLHSSLISDADSLFPVGCSSIDYGIAHSVVH